jgi:UDP-N-acetylmuramoylalanine--D-glutamate ligase
LKIEIKDKNVLVVGLARSGVGAANLLCQLGAEVTVTDIKTRSEIEDFISKLNPAVRLALGAHPEDIFLSADMLVVSPGVPLEIPPISNARSRGIPIIGELELAYQVMTYSLCNPSSHPIITPYPPLERGEFLAVTGTNGKSTTTALLDFMMRKSGFRTILGGNIGNALTEEILKQVKSQNAIDYVVAEVSSFQLESIKDFKPKVAAIINITPDHLDRYYSLEEYSHAKAKIFENQREGDFLVLNADDHETMKVYNAKCKMQNAKLPRVYFFSRKKKVEGLYFKDGIIYCNLPPTEGTVPILPPLAGKSGTVPSVPPHHSSLIAADEIKIKGVHNLENAMAASAMALLANCPVEAVIESLKEFPGLEHRLEFVREMDGVRYFNDSKGTNVGAVTKSLESFTEPIILIAGGRDKAGDFSLLRHLVKEKVKAIVLIGEAGEKIKRTLEDLADTVMAEDLRDAVNTSRSMALKGDVVLLSPACASFDMFLDFEDRGRQFKNIVMEMK